jgi:insulysin
MDARFFVCFVILSSPLTVATALSTSIVDNVSNASLRRCNRAKGSRLFLSSDYDENFSSGHGGTNRREFLTWGPAATTALSVFDFGSPRNAFAANLFDSPYLPKANEKDVERIPYSSARKYKTVTLANGLRALLVNDKRAFRSSAALSIAGAGQFADPQDLPGLAHLMEHMILSFKSRSSFGKSKDFEDWLADVEGASNAFTAYDTVCFHFSCPDVALSEALDRFSGLFLESNVVQVCRTEKTVRREIRRVDSELDFEDPNIQALYLAKDFVNPENPYSRFSAGNLNTLERTPKELGVDVGERLIEFFRSRYRPEQAVLVVVSPQDFFTTGRWIAPFSSILSRWRVTDVTTSRKNIYPGGFLLGNRLKHMVLYCKGESQTEKISFEWTLGLDYADIGSASKPFVTATQIGFILSQIISRRGPGSLYQYLLRRGWVPSGNTGVPRITIPLEVSRFQIIKIEVLLTTEGYLNRSSVVVAVYDCIDLIKKGQTFKLPRELISQYVNVAKLFGYTLAPRPPDAIELAIDAQIFGVGGPNNVGSGKWYRFIAIDERGATALLQRTISIALATMSDPSNALIIASAGNNALKQEGMRLPLDGKPSTPSSKWLSEPVTGGLFFFDDMLRRRAGVETLILSKLVFDEELVRPVFNPLIPIALRPPRNVIEPEGFSNTNERLTFETDQDVSLSKDGNWKILGAEPGQVGLPLPRCPPETTCRCAFTLQLLSPRPARANVRQAAFAELWKLSLELAITDLAELGAPGSLAYDISFNKFGLRLTFLGISQNISSYARRICRRLVKHHFTLLTGPEMLPPSLTAMAVSTASRVPNLSQQRRSPIVSNLRRATSYDAATEGIAFLRSCSGAVCFAEGDLLQSEVVALLSDLNDIFSESIGSGSRSSAAIPTINDLVYKPVWKPRFASSCAVPGVALVSDACGRLPR